MSSPMSIRRSCVAPWRITGAGWRAAVVIGLCVCWADSAVYAQVPGDNDSTSSQTDDRAPIRVKKAKDKKDKKDKKEDKKENKAPKPPKHPTLHVGDQLTLEFTARVESDLRLATPDIGRDSADQEWQDRRIGVEGTAFKRIKFEVSRELGADFEAAEGLSVKTPWRDVYADTRLTKEFNIEAGRFKIPFGYEELTGESNLDFAYRSLAARVLSPSRDVGVMAHGRVFSRLLEYQVGYFTRDGDHMRTSQTEGGQNAFAGRVVVTPFVSSPNHLIAPLQVGVATMQSHLDDRLGVRGRTVLGDDDFFDRVYVNGRRQRLGLEAAWDEGPVSLSTEYITVSDQRQGMGFEGADLESIRSSSWYLAGTWALTGEHKRGRLEPRRELLHGGFGAVELAMRVEGLRFDNAMSAIGEPVDSLAVHGNADHATTIGVNWYLNHYLKLQWDLIRERIDDPERSPAPGNDGRFTSNVIRLQFRL